MKLISLFGVVALMTCSGAAQAQNRGIVLFTSSGSNFFYKADTPVLPPDIDRQAVELSVKGPPVAVFDGQNYTGQQLTLINSGGCTNLATCMPNAGNWANRIRSIQFLAAGDPLLTPGEKLPEAVIKRKHH